MNPSTLPESNTSSAESRRNDASMHSHLNQPGPCACSHPPHHFSVNDLCIRYGEVDALCHVNIDAECGRRLALIGPNGAGKSTLLKALAGLLKPRAGQILWNGKPLSGKGREVAYLPQREEVDWKFPITVRGLVEMGRYSHLGWWRPYRKEDHRAVDRALEMMSMTNLQHRQIRALSGGQQQRAFLARALAQEAHVLLLDEPFGGLDIPSRESLSEVMEQLASENRLLIASHHELDTVPSMFDDVLLLNRTPIAYGPVQDVFTPENLARTFKQAGKSILSPSTSP